MKSIEECLDIILNKLVENWNQPDGNRTYLQGEKLLQEFDLPQLLQKHEFFKRLVDRLVKDGYAELKATGQAHFELSHYQEDTLITIEGYNFINQGGYSEVVNQNKINADAEEAQKQRMEKNEVRLVSWTKRLTWATVIAAGIIVSWEVIKTLLIDECPCH